MAALYGLIPHHPASKKLKSSYNSVLRRMLCKRMPYSYSEICLQVVAFHLFMSYFVNVFLISLGELVRTQIL